MDTFAKYREMASQGATPRQVFLAARADGLDAIALIRLVRTVFGLSLAEAKRVRSEQDVFDAKQDVRVGATVHWEGADTVEGPYFMEARVTGISGDRVFVEGHRKYRGSANGLTEVPLAGDGLASLPLSYFDKPLVERLSESLQFWQKLSEVNGHSGARPVGANAEDRVQPR